MNKQSIRGFGIAIFLVGALIYSMNMLAIPLPGMSVTDAAMQKEIDTLTKQLATANETLAQQEQTASSAPAADVTEPTAAPTEETAPETAENVEHTSFTLTIYRGITSYDISRKLEDEGIIDNALQFELFLVNDGYNKRLQVGEYTITSTMTDEEIATLITTP